MQVTIEKITPQGARSMLKSNSSNRALNKATLERYKKDMAQGNWANDGSPIRFAESGRLLDGQHRLNAVVESGIPIEAVVMRGLKEDAFKTMDTGKARGGADILAINGHVNTTFCAALAGSWLYYCRHGHPANQGGARKVTNAEILEVFENNPEIADAARYQVGHAWIKRHLTAMSFGVLYVACCKRGEREKVLEFFDELQAPTPRSYGTSVMLLRDRLIADRASREKMTKTYSAALVFKAYRDYRDGRQMRTLKIVAKNGKLSRDHFSL